MRLALGALLCLLPLAAQAQQCPQTSAGWTASLTPNPATVIYDSYTAQLTFIATTGATNTFLNVPDAVAQAGVQPRNGPFFWGMIYGSYIQLVLTSKWSCPIITNAGYLESQQ